MTVRLQLQQRFINVERIRFLVKGPNVVRWNRKRSINERRRMPVQQTLCIHRTNVLHCRISKFQFDFCAVSLTSASRRIVNLYSEVRAGWNHKSHIGWQLKHRTSGSPSAEINRIGTESTLTATGKTRSWIKRISNP